MSVMVTTGCGVGVSVAAGEGAEGRPKNAPINTRALKAKSTMPTSTTRNMTFRRKKATAPLLFSIIHLNVNLGESQRAEKGVQVENAELFGLLISLMLQSPIKHSLLC